MVRNKKYKNYKRISSFRLFIHSSIQPSITSSHLSIIFCCSITTTNNNYNKKILIELDIYYYYYYCY